MNDHPLPPQGLLAKEDQLYYGRDKYNELLSMMDHKDCGTCSSSSSSSSSQRTSSSSNKIAKALHCMYDLFCNGLEYSTNGITHGNRNCHKKNSNMGDAHETSNNPLLTILAKNHHFANRNEIVSFLYQVIDYYKEDRQIVQVALYYLDTFVLNWVTLICDDHNATTSTPNTEKNTNDRKNGGTTVLCTTARTSKHTLGVVGEYVMNIIRDCIQKETGSGDSVRCLYSTPQPPQTNINGIASSSTAAKIHSSTNSQSKKVDRKRKVSPTTIIITGGGHDDDDDDDEDAKGDISDKNYCVHAGRLK